MIKTILFMIQRGVYIDKYSFCEAADKSLCQSLNNSGVVVLEYGDYSSCANQIYINRYFVGGSTIQSVTPITLSLTDINTGLSGYRISTGFVTDGVSAYHISLNVNRDNNGDNIPDVFAIANFSITTAGAFIDEQVLVSDQGADNEILDLGGYQMNNGNKVVVYSEHLNGTTSYYLEERQPPNTVVYELQVGQASSTIPSNPVNHNISISNFLGVDGNQIYLGQDRFVQVNSSTQNFQSQLRKFNYSPGSFVEQPNSDIYFRRLRDLYVDNQSIYAVMSPNTSSAGKNIYVP